MYYIKKVNDAKAIESVLISEDIASKKITYNILCGWIADMTKGEVNFNKHYLYGQYLDLLKELDTFSMLVAVATPDFTVVFFKSVKGIRVDILKQFSEIKLIQK